MSAPREKETDFYQILGLDQDASYDQIYEKYLKLSLKYHPDKGGDEDKYRLVNLAYQVLKDPENRKKYDDALATTFNQFKDENRDTEYHVNVDFLTPDQIRGGSVFDLEKFLAEFEAKRDSQKETAEIDPNAVQIPDKRLEDLLASRLADRDQALQSFQTSQRTGLKDPKANPEVFNFVFNQYKSRHSKELEEVDPSNPNAMIADYENGEAPVNFNHLTGNENQSLIQQLVNETEDYIQQTQAVPIVTSEPKPDADLLAQHVSMHHQVRKHLQNPDRWDQSENKYKNELDDSNKPVLPDA